MSNMTDLQSRSASAAPRSGYFGTYANDAQAAPTDRTHLAAAQYRLFAAGSELFAQDEQNEDVFTVVEGWVSLHHILEDGRRQILEFLLPGEICGFPPLAGGRAAHSAEALTDVTVVTLPRAQFASMLAADADYAAAVIGKLFETISSAHESLVDIGRRAAIEAVANLLFRLDRRIREASGAAPGTIVDFPPTQEQLGDALGLSAAHVCRTLRILRERGILSLGRQKLQVHDPGAVRGMLVGDGRRPARRVDRACSRRPVSDSLIGS